MELAMVEMASENHRRGRLLLVDDEENILRSLRRVLRHGDWDIETAPDGQRALELLEDFHPDVVVSDFRMPGMSGVDLLHEVKLRSPQTQRILLTGHADHQALEEAINRSEIFRFIGKPWNDAQLVLTVRSAFEQHRLISEHARLLRLTQEQNRELRELNAELEARVQQRTLLLSRAKREWELSFDAIDTPMAIVGEGLVIRRANRAAAALMGRPVTDLNKRPHCHEFLFGRSSRCDGCPLHDDLAEPRSSELKHRERTYVAQAFPMSGDEPVAVCIYRDVTDERALTRRLIESEKMIAIGNLAGGVAHEINNPLGGILAFSQLMKREPGRSPSDIEALGLIEESALRCKRIVESLLKFSRQPRAEDRREVDLSRCVEDAVLLFRAEARKHPQVQVDMRLQPGLLVYADAAQLGQVVLNLLRNAMQALREQKGTVSVVSGARDGHVFFSVSDTGCGIPPENLPRIFEPHFTTKPPGEGTGLGLSIAYRIVEDHGGHFTVESTEDVGSTFTVTLPRSRASEGAA
jgi:two-component system NtrC family sensor kinase